MRCEPFSTDGQSVNEPLYVVDVGGRIVLFSGDVQIVISIEAAEETSRRLASVAAIARMVPHR